MMEDPWLTVPRRTLSTQKSFKISRCLLLVGWSKANESARLALIGPWSQDLFATLLTGVTLGWPSDGWVVTFLLHTISGEDPGTVGFHATA